MSDRGSQKILADLAAYWGSLRHDGGLPSRADVQPARIARLLPHVMLLDVVSTEPLVVRYRVHGSEMARRLGYDGTGKSMREVYQGTNWPAVEAALRRVASEAEPLSGHLRDDRRDGRMLEYDWVLLPLASDGVTVDAILGAVVESASEDA